MKLHEMSGFELSLLSAVLAEALSQGEELDEVTVMGDFFASLAANLILIADTARAEPNSSSKTRQTS